jgi:Leucine-rich repeat (LRR) protein
MLTRKRQKLLDSQEKLNLEMSSRVFQFDPILESVSQFLYNRDCANVSKLSHSYHSKTWLYILKSPNRAKINDIIDLNDYSWYWILKYRLHLKHQSIQFLYRVKFDLSIIPQLYSLNVYEPMDKFPGQVKHLTLSGLTDINTFPNIIGVETLFVPHYDSHSGLLKTCPQTITSIKIQSAWWFNCQDLPNLPNLETLFLRVDYMKNVQTIQEKFPNLKILHIISNSLVGIEELENFRGKLVVGSRFWQSTQVFANFKTQDLDLSQCPNILDFSGVAHIPIVKRL